MLDAGPLAGGLLVLGVGLVPWYVSLLGRLLGRGGTPASTAGWLVTGTVLSVLALAWLVFSRWWLGGRTGQSIGHRAAGTTVVAAVNGNPIGTRYSALRDLIHLLDIITVVGALWPLWDRQRRTFADVLMQTESHVIDHRNPQAGP